MAVINDPSTGNDVINDTTGNDVINLVAATMQFTSAGVTMWIHDFRGGSVRRKTRDWKRSCAGNVDVGSPRYSPKDLAMGAVSTNATMIACRKTWLSAARD